MAQVAAGLRFRDGTGLQRVRSLEQLRVAEDLNDLNSTAGVLLVDAQGHGVISAKIASTVHDTFHAFMLSELDHHGKTTPELFEQINHPFGAVGNGPKCAGESVKETPARSRRCSTARFVRPAIFAS